jgi:hypothetical protein
MPPTPRCKVSALSDQQFLGLSSSLSALRAREAKPSAARCMGAAHWAAADFFFTMAAAPARAGEAARPMGSSPPRAAGDNLVGDTRVSHFAQLSRVREGRGVDAGAGESARARGLRATAIG